MIVVATMLSTTAEQLISIVEAASKSLNQIDEVSASSSTASDRWSKKQIIGHLIDSAVNNHQRFVRAQQAATEFSFPAYEQESWVALQRYETSRWTELVELWRLYNRHLAQIIENISEAKLDVICRIGENEPVSLGYLVKDYLRHLQHHLAQLGVDDGKEESFV